MRLVLCVLLVCVAVFVATQAVRIIGAISRNEVVVLLLSLMTTAVVALLLLFILRKEMATAIACAMVAYLLYEEGMTEAERGE